MFVPLMALISVWQRLTLELKGPTESSEIGMVRLKGDPEVVMNVKSIAAGREETWEQGMP